MANYFNGYQQQQQQNNGNVFIVTVQGEQGASMYPVAPNNTAFLFDFNQKKFWIKATDNNGLPARFSAFEFKEILQPQGGNNFVLRNEFDEWKKSTDAQLQQIIGNLNVLIGGNSNVSANAKQPTAVSTTV